MRQAPVLDARAADSDLRAGRVATSRTTSPTRGATMNIDNNSLFVQDHWAINDRWSADLGVRFEHVQGRSRPATSSASTPAAHRAAARPELRPQGRRQPHRPRHLRRSTRAATTRRRSAATARSATRRLSRATTPGPAGSGDERLARPASTSPTTRSPRRTSSASKCRWPTSSSTRS